MKKLFTLIALSMLLTACGQAPANPPLYMQPPIVVVPSPYIPAYHAPWYYHTHHCPQPHR